MKAVLLIMFIALGSLNVIVMRIINSDISNWPIGHDNIAEDNDYSRGDQCGSH